MKVTVRQSKRGFTLIELLVVIAIIAILAAILFPVFAQARKKAYQAAGTSNAKQAALAIIMYTQDYDEKMPRAGWGCQGYAGGDTKTFAPGDENSCGATEWQNTTYPYTKNGGIYKSPGDASTHNFTWSTDLSADDGNFSLVINDLLSHTLANDANGYGDSRNGQNHKADGLSQAAINAPADCLLLCEAHCGWNKVDGQGFTNSDAAHGLIPATGKTCKQDVESKWCKEQSLSGYQTSLLCPSAYGGTSYIVGSPFYMGGGIVAFADGHAKYVKYTDSSGNPVLCSTLPWPKSVDPQQRHADLNSCNDPKNPVHSGNANWD